MRGFIGVDEAQRLNGSSCVNLIVMDKCNEIHVHGRMPVELSYGKRDYPV
jgi:hypothetical protein